MTMSIWKSVIIISQRARNISSFINHETYQERRLNGNSVANARARFNRRGQFYPTPERHTPWYYRLCKGRLEGAESSSWVRQRPEEEREEERDKKWNESLRRSTRVYTFLFPRLKTGLRNRTASQPHYTAYLTSTETDSASVAESPGCISQRSQGSADIYTPRTLDYRRAAQSISFERLKHSSWNIE